MLLTIHNLPASSRYSDIKGLLNEKCGLTEIILDNLVAEGKGKKVTVGLANDDDGALVVRKINGLFLGGHQLYIEDRRRKTSERDQPYRASGSYVQEARGAEPIHSNNAMGVMPMAATVPVIYNAATPYMVQVPVDQNMAHPDTVGDVLQTASVPVKSTKDNRKSSLKRTRKHEVSHLVSSILATYADKQQTQHTKTNWREPSLLSGSERECSDEYGTMPVSRQITCDDTQFKRPMTELNETSSIVLDDIKNTNQKRSKKKKRMQVKENNQIKKEICSKEETTQSSQVSVENMSQNPTQTNLRLINKDWNRRRLATQVSLKR